MNETELAKSIEERIYDIEIAQANHIEKFGLLQTAVFKTHDGIRKLQEDVKPINPQFCEQMEERHKFLTEALHLTIHKISVLTEVAYALRQADDLTAQQRERVLQAIIYCIDLPDDFWQNKGSTLFSVSDWAEVCLTEARRAKLLVVSEDA